jgi:hypothetical protein
LLGIGDMLQRAAAAVVGRSEMTAARHDDVVSHFEELFEIYALAI